MSRSKSSSGPRHGPRASRLATPGSLETSVAPMRWDDGEGAYMAMLVVGHGVVELVLDTGSSQLSVKGEGCRWRTCDTDGGCEETSCPCGEGRGDCRDYYYRPAGYRVEPGEAGAGINTVMTYGSQVDTIEHYMDTIHVPVTPGMMTCAGLFSPPIPDEFDMLGTTPPRSKDYKQAIVHRVKRIDGTSSSNLLGLSRPNKGSVEHGSRVLLDTLVGSMKTWSIVLYPQGGWLAFDRMPCFPPPHYIPIIQPSAFNGFLTSFYIVNISEILVGDTEDSMRPVKHAPQYGVIDTGTTFTYGSPHLGRQLDEAGYREPGSWVQLKLGSRQAPLTLTYSPSHLRDPDSRSQNVIQAWPGRTLDDFDRIFQPKRGGVLLLGALMMRGMYWEFDLAHKRIGISDLRTSLKRNPRSTR